MAQLQEVTPDAPDNSGPIFDTEPLQKVPNNDNYNAFAIESEHPEQSKSVNDTYPIEQDAHNVIIDSLDMPPESDEVIHLEKESRSKLSDLIRPFDYEKLNNLYDLFVSQREKSSAQKYFSERINVDLEKFHLYLKEEMVADLRYFNSLELEVDSLKSQLETQKTQFLNEIDRLSREYYYANHMNAILGVYTELDEVTNLQCDYLETLEKCECLEKELSKSKIMSNSFEALQKHAINLELDLHQCKEKIKNEKSFKDNQSKEFRKEREQYFKIQDLKAQLQDKGIAISELKKLIEKLKGKSVETKFEKSSVILQPNAFKSQRPSILGKPTIFSDSLEKKDCSQSKSVTKNDVSNDFSKPVTAQILPSNNKSILKHTNVIASGMYKLLTEPIQTRTTQLHHDIRKTNKRLVEISLFIVDSGCSKHMTRNLKLLTNFVEKFLGSVKFENDQIAPILGYEDLKSTCYIRDLKGNDLLTGIQHQTPIARTPEQNGVVKRRKCTLVKAARTMLSAAKVPLYFWAEAIATAYFTQNRSLVIPRHEK
nr:putative ribonuclease H-like domain-containing protein [Tanacetum cinerariifolium]